MVKIGGVECGENWVVNRDGEPDLKFTGDMLASASSSANQASPDYSGSTGRWVELKLFRTSGGNYVCSQVSKTQWQGEQDGYSGAVCKSIEEVFTFFGHGKLAKEIYADAGLDATVVIE